MRLLILLLMAGSSHAALAEALRVKPGLWEITTHTTIKSSGVPDSIKLDKMTPEQQTRAERMLAERDQPRTSTTQSCLTPAQIESGEGFEGGKHHTACTRKAVNHSATEWTTELQCSGRVNVNGQIQIKAPDATHMTGSIRMKTLYGRNERETYGEISSKWLSADCSSLTRPAGKAEPKK